MRSSLRIAALRRNLPLKPWAFLVLTSLLPALLGAPAKKPVVLPGEPDYTADPAGQWAVSAEAGSQYHDSGDYSAAQATGAPDVPAYGGHASAWTCKTLDAGHEWLLLRYAQPVQASAVRVRQNYHPGAIVKVEVLDTAGHASVVWSGKDTTNYGTNRIGWFVATFPATTQPVNAVRLSLVTSRTTGWPNIDAVQLVGTPAKSSSTAAASLPTTATAAVAPPSPPPPAATQPAPPPAATTAPAPATTAGVVGVWWGARFMVGGAGAQLAEERLVFLADGTFIFDLPLRGLDRLDAGLARAEQPNLWGRYTLEGDHGLVTGVNNWREEFRLTPKGTLAILGTEFARGHCPTGWRLAGRYAVDGMPDRDLTFTPDGRFTDRGLLSAGDILGRLTAMQAPGGGMYEIRNFSLVLSYADGRQGQVSFYVATPAEAATPSPDAIFMNKLRRVRVP